MPLPPVARLSRNNTHRLIPAGFGGPQEPLREIAETPNQLKDLLDLASVTDEMRLTESGLLPALSQDELAAGVPHARIINAAFVYAHPAGSRFNGADRGAWYAAFQLVTAQAEVAFHKTVHLAEIGRYEDEVEFDDYLADFHCELHDLRRTRLFASSLDPISYVASHTLAEKLLERGSSGVIYPSVRRVRGTCLRASIRRRFSMCEGRSAFDLSGVASRHLECFVSPLRTAGDRLVDRSPSKPIYGSHRKRRRQCLDVLRRQGY
jgi:hypothetical protein